MKLIHAQITEFQSIRDSNPFSITDITCLVGKNEAGKSAVLQALYRLNPVIKGADHYSVTDDYPSYYCYYLISKKWLVNQWLGTAREIVTRCWFALMLLTAGCSSMPSLTPSPKDHKGQQLTSAPVTTDIAGKAATAVRQGVMRVMCSPTAFGGTGFLHKSGNVITAAHVVKDCKPPDLLLITPTGQRFTVINVDADEMLDLALLRPAIALPGQPITIALVAPPTLGMQVATWGYPGGYNGLAPLLSVGYLAGTQDFKVGGSTVQRWVVNAAFNGGNSGGPVLSIENGSIVGVVSSKLAPLPDHIATILDLLGKQTSGFIHYATKPDGSEVTYTEGQLIGEVLQYLRGQVQLVIGYAVSPDDIVNFLKTRNVLP